VKIGKENTVMTTMRALLRFPGEKRISVTNCPIPALRPGCILVKTTRSLISNGTETTQNHETRLPLIAKAWQRPDLTAQVIDKLRRDGISATRNAVQNRLDRPIAAGYASCGIVTAVAPDVQDFTPGMHVACGGINHACHAEWNIVPQNMACPVPNGVTDDNAVFTTLASITFHALRQGEVGIGMTIAIIGCGLVGQLVIQLAQAAGARTIAIDPQISRQNQARQNGAIASFDQANAISAHALANLTHDIGCDAVFICAPDHHGTLIDAVAPLCRDRAIIVCVGDVTPKATRNLLFRKEITLRQVRSYGPGRYDDTYEQHGQDYPAGYVRWTIKRNMRAVLDLMADNRIHPASLIDARITLEDADKPPETGPAPLATIISYDRPAQSNNQTIKKVTSAVEAPQLQAPHPVTLALIGAGNFAGITLIPALKKIADARISYVVSTTGLTAMGACRRIPGAKPLTEYDDVLNDTSLDAVIIATQHDSHCSLAAKVLEMEKHVWVEKPLAIDLKQLEDLEKIVVRHPDKILMVGHNRRYAPLTRIIADHLPGGPKHFAYHVRLSPLPSGHWLHHPTQGGRAIGEVSHFIDVISRLANSPLINLQCHWINRSMGDSIWNMQFEDSSHATLHYGQGGTKRDAKETLHITAPDTTITLTDWHRLSIHQSGKKTTRRSGRLWPRTPQKGHIEALQHFIDKIAQANRTNRETGINNLPSAINEIRLCRMILNAAYGTPA
jgi:predicted dehydrogenase